MPTDAKIEAKRDELRQLKQREEELREELHALFRQRAAELCPIQIGAKVEYEDGKFGQVDRIEFHVDFFGELNSGAEVHWTVSGRKLNKDGQFGKKDFGPVGPASHFVRGTRFEPKGLSGIVGIDDSGE